MGLHYEAPLLTQYMDGIVSCGASLLRESLQGRIGRPHPEVSAGNPALRCWYCSSSFLQRGGLQGPLSLTRQVVAAWSIGLGPTEPAIKNGKGVEEQLKGLQRPPRQRSRVPLGTIREAHVWTASG